MTRIRGGGILFDAAIGARERVYEPGQDRKIATVLHVSVMRFWSPYLIPSYVLFAVLTFHRMNLSGASKGRSGYSVEIRLVQENACVLSRSRTQISALSI